MKSTTNASEAARYVSDACPHRLRNQGKGKEVKTRLPHTSRDGNILASLLSLYNSPPPQQISKQRIYNGEADVSAIAMLLLVLIGSTCLSYFLIPFALKYLRATTVSVYMNMQPIVASIASICIGQDVFSWDKPVALALVIAGAMVVTHSPSKEEKQTE